MHKKHLYRLYCLQMPEALAKRVPSDFELAGTRKGFKRYTSPDLKDILKGQAEAQEAVEAVLNNILQVHLLGRSSLEPVKGSLDFTPWCHSSSQPACTCGCCTWTSCRFCPLLDYYGSSVFQGHLFKQAHHACALSFFVQLPGCQF